MKKILLSLLGVCTALSLLAQEFEYEYEGQKIRYVVVDETAKTCRTLEGMELDCLEPPYASAGNYVEGALILPSVVVNPQSGEEYTLVSIGENGFIGCRGLTSVMIPESVESIGYDAFSYCTSLELVSLPSTLKTVKDGAFSTTPLLSAVTIPESLTVISDGLFAGSGLTSIFIPATVSEIGENAFWQCNHLTEINVSEANPVYASVDGVLYNKDVTSLLSCPGGKSSLVVPDGVETIVSYALGGNSGITSVALSSSVKTIEEFAFERATGLTSLSFGSAEIESIADYTFFGCTSLASINFPSSLTTIGNNVFDGCTSLASVNFPSSLTTIGNYVFSGCTSLTSVNFPTSLTSIGNNVFDGCTSLVNIDLGEVQTIGKSCFNNCTALKEITIPASVQSIATPIFEGCQSLKAINVEEESEMYASLDGVLFNKDITALLEFPRGRNDLSIPASVVEIGPGAVSGVTLPASPALSENIKAVGAGAFKNCTGFDTLTIPRYIESMGENAFDCPDVTSVYYNMPEAKSLPVNPFGDIMPAQSTLYPPKAVAKYLRSYSPWNKFKKILSYEFEDGVEDVAADFDSSLPYMILDIAGRFIATEINALPAGVFIVRQGDTARKIIVK
ncbi:MAG: leucine-rich repeat domain-containing protein [Bacteroidales bacterium]|nr:leucine-rich repeat domain-containing protein [Bacteroidales bacterium]